MKITFLNPGLNEANIEQPCSIIDAIKASNPEALATACAAKVNGTLTDLRATIAEDASVEILDTTSSDALHILRHTTAHILAEAVKRLYPDAKLTIGPATENGFYYDFECKPFTKDELDAIEKEMKAIIKKGPRIERREVSRNEAMEIMSQRGESYKVEILNEIPEDETITIYTQNDFVELCTGPHIINTKMIKGFKLLSASTTYWRGDKNNAVLSRIYGTAFFTKEDLAAGGLLKTTDHVQGGGFTATGGSQQADELAIGDLEGKVIDGNDLLACLFVSAGENLCQILQYYFHTNSLPIL